MRRLFSQLLALNQSRAVFDLIIDCSHFTCGPFDSLADSWKMGEAVTTSASVNTTIGADSDRHWKLLFEVVSPAATRKEPL